MIEAAAKLPPGPEAWEPIFEAYPEVTPDFLLSRRIDPAARPPTARAGASPGPAISPTGTARGKCAAPRSF